MVSIPSVLAAVLVAAAPATAQEWPQWRGPSRDGAAPALARRTDWPPALKPAWKVPAGAGYAAPVVAGGRVFLFARNGEQETLQALDLATGARVWQQSYAAPYQVNPAAYAHGPGPRATPVVAGGRVFTFGISGILSAHDAASGRLLWRKEFAGEFKAAAPTYGTAQSPLVDGGRVIVHVGGSGGGALAAFDAATGAVAWSWKGDAPAYASPIVAELGGVRQVIAFTESLLVGLAADSGRLLWKQPFSTEYEQNAVTPLIANGGLLVYSGLDHPLTAVRVSAGGASWSVAPAWDNADVALYMSSPVAVDGRVCGLSHRRRGQLFCVDAASGKTVWLSEGRLGDNAALVSAGSYLLVQTTDGQLLVVDASGPAYRLLRQWTVAKGATWAHPAVLAEGVLIRDADSLAFLRF